MMMVMITKSYYRINSNWNAQNTLIIKDILGLLSNIPIFLFLNTVFQTDRYDLVLFEIFKKSTSYLRKYKSLCK